MSVVAAYITREDATSLLIAELSSTDDRRDAWTSAGTANQDIFLRRATADIDAMRWRGARSDQNQQLSMPVVDEHGNFIDPDPDPPVSPPSPELAYIPRAFRVACAIQAAHHAARNDGADPTHVLEDAARRGVVSQSGGGFSEAVDLRVANDPWSRLALEAQQMLRRYRLVGGMLL